VDTLTLLCTVIPVTVTATLGTKYYFAFRGKQLEFNSARDTENFLREEADISDMWIEVVSNHEDTEIITVRGGFTPQETTP